MGRGMRDAAETDPESLTFQRLAEYILLPVHSRELMDDNIFLMRLNVFMRSLFSSKHLNSIVIKNRTDSS